MHLQLAILLQGVQRGGGARREAVAMHVPVRAQVGHEAPARGCGMCCHSCGASSRMPAMSLRQSSPACAELACQRRALRGSGAPGPGCRARRAAMLQALWHVCGEEGCLGGRQQSAPRERVQLDRPAVARQARQHHVRHGQARADHQHGFAGAEPRGRCPRIGNVARRAAQALVAGQRAGRQDCPWRGRVRRHGRCGRRPGERQSPARRCARSMATATPDQALQQRAQRAPGSRQSAAATPGIPRRVRAAGSRWQLASGCERRAKARNSSASPGVADMRPAGTLSR